MRAFDEYYKELKTPNIPPKEFSLVSFLIFIIVFALYLFLAPMIYFSGVYIRDHQKGCEQITLSNVRLSRSLGFEHGRAGDPYIVLMKIKDIHSFVFYTSSDTSYFKPMRANMDITILKYDYDIKIAHTRKPTFWDKHFDWRRIHVLGISYSDVALDSLKHHYSQ